ncbi:MAG: hypothetical protein JSV02_01575 [Dehalococcoidia bacterium]|nr:MAG: hypothetical protein JSV02_01575 [Dehalococcoidia bacterium]
MLFHVTHVHTPESCPAHDPEKARNTFGKVLSSAEEVGVKLLGAWVDAPSHTVYLVVETDSVSKLSDLFFPALAIGSADISPVEDALALLQRRFSES